MARNEETSVAEYIGYWFAAIPIVFIIAAICAIVDMNIWNWFVEPFFHTFHMTLFEAMGLGIIVRLSQYSPIEETKSDDSLAYIKYVGRKIKQHYELLLMGFIIHLFL